ncbi:MAG: hypothetical protein ACI9K5_003784, partial [Gammaproteobacteria bacterium]
MDYRIDEGQIRGAPSSPKPPRHHRLVRLGRLG